MCKSETCEPPQSAALMLWCEAHARALQHSPGDNESADLAGGEAGRRCGWLLGQRLDKDIGRRHGFKKCGRNEQEALGREREFKFRQCLGVLGFLVGFPGFGDDLAKGARVLPIERACDGFRE